MQFGATVRKIVEGETKPSDSDSKCTAVSKLPSKVAGYNDCAIAAKQKECKDTSTSTASTSTSAQDKQASNLRHMLIAMSEDWRGEVENWRGSADYEYSLILDPVGHAQIKLLLAHRARYTQHTQQVLEQQREWLAEQLASHPLLQGKFSPESNGFSTNGFSVAVETMPLYAAYRALQKSGGNFYDVHDA
eukprot:12829-Heterococcus_DN1.PRE.1